MSETVSNVPALVEQDTQEAKGSLDREIGRLEGRVDSLEKTVERLEVSVNGLVSIIDFAKKALRLVYSALALIGVDGFIRLVGLIHHVTGHG